ncbi:hypothetical protein D3C78_1480630 [compost metagenome]
MKECRLVDGAPAPLRRLSPDSRAALVLPADSNRYSRTARELLVLPESTKLTMPVPVALRRLKPPVTLCTCVQPAPGLLP